ncbi:KH domain-containing, RNA-binding, signal transduction-associated protein 3-like [Diorhabda sublineata]|uniref:KH domain-containing, RNA-binding, signal transduction-associated protein 3-like n=1 Tax=Diorhabda sublineata TaxID=1163346 RepID=UPI0024E187F1|nr:KH domain-containing, RNA-binding, signal transduction-associated protein 3-like [Diorhabda sublineata]XP_056633306.1 KH domain-containing, RNA-binding, signal transduction-associated protein 3-like [Diorhabda sublineata]
MKSDEEMGRDKASGAMQVNQTHHSKNKGGESRRMLDITRDKPIKVAVRVVVPVRDHPKFNFVGKLLGPKGNSLKRLQEDTMCKMAVLGRGSMKDRHKEEELRASGDPKFQHLSEELHVEISAFATPAEAHARIAYALAEVRRFLVPDYNDDIRQEQMWEMQVLSNQKNNKSDDSNVGVTQNETGEDRLSDGETGEANNSFGVHLQNSKDDTEHPAMRGIQTGIAPTAISTDILAPINGTAQQSPTSAEAAGASVCPVAAAAALGTRKRPLLAGGPRTSMTPTKRTVMSLLARARAAQAKQLPGVTGTTAFARGVSVFDERAPTLVPLLREDYMSAVNLNLI